MRLASNHAETEADELDGLWKEQPFDRLSGECESGTSEKRGLGESGDCLAFTVTEAMVLVGRPLGVAHTAESGEGSSRVHECVHSRGKQSDRAGDYPRRELDHDQDHGKHETNSAGEPTRACIEAVPFLHITASQRMQHAYTKCHGRSKRNNAVHTARCSLGYNAYTTKHATRVLP